MPQFRVHPIDPSLAQAVRETLRDPVYGLPLRIEPATGYGPCRSCLQTFAPGEPRILFLYNPFEAAQTADFAGPVYVHASACPSYAQTSLFPPDIEGLPVVLRAYDEQRRLVVEATPRPGGVAATLEAMFDSPRVRAVHLRNAEAKCYIARAERAASPAHQPNVFTSSR